MKIKPEQLNATLAKQLDAIYFVFGAELLLIEKSLTQIKTSAKQQGFNERVGFEIDGSFNWQKITTEISSPSLFTQKRLIECRLTTGKIGLEGAKALSEIANTIPQDVLLLISTGKLSGAQQKSKWVKTLAERGSVIQHWEVKKPQLVGWIANHMAELGLVANLEVAQNIAFCTEGNLLASMQEIQKLKMTYSDGKIDTNAYVKQNYQQSKYTVYTLLDTALLGDVNQVEKIYHSLIDDQAMPAHLSAVLYNEISAIIEMSLELQQVKNINTVLKNHQVWRIREPAITQVLKRHSYQFLQKILLSLGRIDRSIKGMDDLNVIDEFRLLLFNLAGKTLWNQ